MFRVETVTGGRIVDVGPHFPTQEEAENFGRAAPLMGQKWRVIDMDTGEVTSETNITGMPTPEQIMAQKPKATE